MSVCFTPTLAPMPRGILATCTARPDGVAGRSEACARSGSRRVRGRAVRARAAPRAGGRGRRTRSARTPCTCRWRSTGIRPGRRPAAVDNLTKGTAGGAVQCVNLALDLPERSGCPSPGWHRERHLAAGVPRRGVTAGLKPSGRPDIALVVNDGRCTPPPPSSPSTGSRPHPSSGRGRSCPTARVDAVVLNSGGANACTGPEGFLDTHRTAERAAALLGVSAGDVAVCSTGLIGERLPMDLLLPGVAAAAAA